MRTILFLRPFKIVAGIKPRYYEYVEGFPDLTLCHSINIISRNRTNHDTSIFEQKYLAEKPLFGGSSEIPLIQPLNFFQDINFFTKCQSDK